MKKIKFILLSIIFIASQADASFLQMRSAYEIGTPGRTVDDLAVQWQPPVRSVNILSNRPLKATDKEGNHLYYTTNGRMAVSFDKDGKATFSLGNMTITKDREGNVSTVSRHIKGSDLIEITNEFGEVLSYKQLGFGGKVVATYDKDKNLTATYNYNQYGKALVSIKNEMTQGLTIFDEKTGLPQYDLDVDGNRMMKYIYDDYGRLKEKVDSYGNIMYFDNNGAITHTTDKDGIVMAKYNYEYDEKNNYVLKSILNPQTRDITYFDNLGRQTVTKNYAGAVTTDYLWNGSKLVATFNRESQETTWYEVDGRVLYTSFNDQVISKNLYYKGQLVGIWDARKNQVTVLQNERREVVVQLGSTSSKTPVELTTLVRCTDKDGHSTVLTLEQFKENSNLGAAYENVEEFQGYVLKSDENGNIVEYDPVVEPTAEMIMQWINSGLIDKKYLFNPL